MGVSEVTEMNLIRVKSSLDSEQRRLKAIKDVLSKNANNSDIKLALDGLDLSMESLGNAIKILEGV